MSILHVIGYKASESLLTCCIPKLNSVMFTVSGYVFNVKIYADCRLMVTEIITLEPYSNLSFIYFSMIEDFPTDWSPSRINLYFVRPPPMVLDETLIRFYKLLFKNTSSDN